MIWMQSERGFDESVAILYGVYSTIFMTIGMLSGGLLSDVYTRHFRGGRARFLALFMLESKGLYFKELNKVTKKIFKHNQIPIL